MAPRKSKGKVVKKRKNQLSFLKDLTKWLCSTDRNKEVMIHLIDSYDAKSSTVFKRIMSYCYNMPHIIWYFNKYLNNLYEFSRMNIIELIYTVAHIMDANMHNRSNKFYYLKSDTERDLNKDKVKPVIKQYFETIHNQYLNDQELNFMYILFQLKKITIDEILHMDQCVNGKESKIKLNIDSLEESQDMSQEQLNEYIDNLRVRPLSPNINQYVLAFREKLKERKECQTCKLADKQNVILDTNIDSLGPVDIVFISVNPTTEEAPYDKPLVDKAGVYHRKHMIKLPSDTKWLITNVILCSTYNQKEIGTGKTLTKVVNNCKTNLLEILQQFPATYYVPMGTIAKDIFGIKGSIIANSGKIIDGNNNTKIIPLPHPSAAMQYENSQQAYAIGWDTIYQIFGQNKDQQSIVQQNNKIEETLNNIQEMAKAPSSKYNIDPSRLITEVSDQLTLFDIVSIDSNNILKIFLDPNGIKLYQIIPHKKPIFIKQQDWKQCNTLTNEMDYVVYVNHKTNFDIMRAVRDNLNVTKRSAAR